MSQPLYQVVTPFHAIADYVSQCKLTPIFHYNIVDTIITFSISSLDVTTGDEIPGTGPGPGTEAAGKHHLELRCQNLVHNISIKHFELLTHLKPFKIWKFQVRSTIINQDN